MSVRSVPQGIAGDLEMEPKVAQQVELIGPDRLQQLMKRSDLPAWAQTLSHAGALGVTGVALHALWGSWWGVPLFLLQGTLLAYAYAAQHEFSHLTPFRTRWLNFFWGHAFGFIRFKPFHFDRMYHMLHHQYTRLRGRDTELDAFTAERKPFTVWEYVVFLLALNLHFKLIVVLCRRLFGGMLPRDAEFSERDRRIFVAEARWYALGYVAIAGLSIYFGSWAALQVWLLPLFTMKWTHQIHNTAEHYGLAKIGDILTNTRTIYTTPINRWLVWQMSYHTAHHRYANVPFYQLRDVDRIIRPYIRHTTNGYISLHTKILKAALAGRAFGYEGRM